MWSDRIIIVSTFLSKVMDLSVTFPKTIGSTVPLETFYCGIAENRTDPQLRGTPTLNDSILRTELPYFTCYTYLAIHNQSDVLLNFQSSGAPLQNADPLDRADLFEIVS